MFRGLTQFKCRHCGKKYTAPDIEWAATIYTTPQPCPYCGSRDTYYLKPFDRLRDLMVKLFKLKHNG